MKQNKYDDPSFFANYSQMVRSIGGLDAAGEWHAFRALLPRLHDKNVLDLGCDFGWHCRYAREQQARSVVGIDLSEKAPTIPPSRSVSLRLKTSTFPRGIRRGGKFTRLS